MKIVFKHRVLTDIWHLTGLFVFAVFVLLPCNWTFLYFLWQAIDDADYYREPNLSRAYKGNKNSGDNVTQENLVVLYKEGWILVIP